MRPGGKPVPNWWLPVCIAGGAAGGALIWVGVFWLIIKLFEAIYP